MKHNCTADLHFNAITSTVVTLHNLRNESRTASCATDTCQLHHTNQHSLIIKSYKFYFVRRYKYKEKC